MNSYSPLETTQKVAHSRRDFLRTAAGVGLGNALFTLNPVLGAAAKKSARKIIVVTFGGGARDQETFSPEGQENIPHLVRELVPQATFFTQVVNGGILGHYCATASLATGVYERINNFSSLPPEHPTVFEYFRKDLRRHAADAWVVAPSNGFNRIGESAHRSYGVGLGAGVILPKHLLMAATAGNHRVHEHLLRDNYETPYFTPQLQGNEFQLRQLEEILQLSVGEFTAHARTVSSPDELSVYIARRLMRQHAPSLLWITLHDIDIAHAGAYSLYIDAIRRTDRLCAELWQAVQDEPEYAGKTMMFVMPDFGRDADEDADGNGFQHHRTGGVLSRTSWMMVLGSGVRERTLIDRRIESIDLTPTVGALLGFTPSLAAGTPVVELVS